MIGMICKNKVGGAHGDPYRSLNTLIIFTNKKRIKCMDSVNGTEAMWEIF